ncbi:unnamed protein product [Ectocarpus fasciculatus]
MGGRTAITSAARRRASATASCPYNQREFLQDAMQCGAASSLAVSLSLPPSAHQRARCMPTNMDPTAPSSPPKQTAAPTLGNRTWHHDRIMALYPSLTRTLRFDPPLAVPYRVAPSLPPLSFHFPSLSSLAFISS